MKVTKTLKKTKCTDDKLYALHIGWTNDNDQMNKSMSRRKIGIGHILRELTLDTADVCPHSSSEFKPIDNLL
jgi:hypothetical protein